MLWTKGERVNIGKWQQATYHAKRSSKQFHIKGYIFGVAATRLGYRNFKRGAQAKAKAKPAAPAAAAPAAPAAAAAAAAAPIPLADADPPAAAPGPAHAAPVPADVIVPVDDEVAKPTLKQYTYMSMEEKRRNQLDKAAKAFGDISNFHKVTFCYSQDIIWLAAKSLFGKHRSDRRPAL